MSQLILIKKTVSKQFNYWWNAKTEHWEGLRQNATPMDATKAQQWFIRLGGNKSSEISFENL